MNIGMDIDDTITNTSKEIDIWAKEYTEKVLKRKFELQELEIFDSMWARHLYNWTIEEDKNFWDLYYEKIMENVKPKDDAVEVINELEKHNEIIIITARWDRENEIISKITKKWLEQNNIKYSKLFMGYKDKRNIAKENNIELFIDDSYITCKEIFNIGIRTMMMNSRINHHFNDRNIERVFTWKEIKDKLGR